MFQVEHFSCPQFFRPLDADGPCRRLPFAKLRQSCRKAFPAKPFFPQFNNSTSLLCPTKVHEDITSGTC